MRFPWQRRAAEREAEAHRSAEDAAEQLRTTQERWPEVIETARHFRRERELNGWTSTVNTIFGGR